MTWTTIQHPLSFTITRDTAWGAPCSRWISVILSPTGSTIVLTSDQCLHIHGSILSFGALALEPVHHQSTFLPPKRRNSIPAHSDPESPASLWRSSSFARHLRAAACAGSSTVPPPEN